MWLVVGRGEKGRGDLPQPSVFITAQATPDATLHIQFFSYNKKWGKENREKHWVSSLMHSAVGAAFRAQENHVTLFPGGTGHAPCYKHSTRERKVLSLQALGLETRYLVREWDQPTLRWELCVRVLGSWKG